jgi:hypothetical protein
MDSGAWPNELISHTRADRGKTMADEEHVKKGDEAEAVNARTASDYVGAIGAAGTTVKAGIISSLKGIDEIEAKIVALARNTVSGVLRTSGSLSSEAVTIVRDVVRGAIAATDEVGAGLVLSTKSVAKGVTMGVSDVGGDVIAAASAIGEAAVKGAAAVGGDVALVAKRTVDGVAEAVQESGGNIVDAVSAAANGAVVGAGSIGKTAVNSVREILLAGVEGVKQVASAALPHRPQTTQTSQ